MSCEEPEASGPLVGGSGPDAADELSATAPDDFVDIVQVTVDGILLVDAAGEVRFANPAAARVLGRGLGELRELPFGLPMTGGVGLAQLDVARPDGSEVVVEMHAAPLRWRGVDVQVVTLRDITSRVSAERRLARSEERFALSAWGANDGLYDWDRDTGLVHTSARLQEMLGEQARELDVEPGSLWERIHPDDVESLRHGLDRHLAGDTGRFRHEFRVRRGDGSWLWVMARGIAVSDGEGLRRFAGSLTDVSDRKQAEEALRRLALHDTLTGLANRALFLDHLTEAIGRAHRSGTSFAVLFLDLDRFKLVNDSLGHAAGDVLLREVGRRVEQCVRATDTVARLGGDEYAVLLDVTDGLADVLSTVTRIRRAVATPLRVGSHVVYTTASIGVAQSRDVGTDPETALRYADIAMYAAKGAGRNSYRLFHPQMHVETARRLQTHSDLHAAVRQGRLFPRYQPIVELTSGRVVAFEALVRWRRSPGSVLDASAFIAAAEETDVVLDIGREMLARAAGQVCTWRAAGFDVGVTVNVAERQLLETDVVAEVGMLLRRFALDGAALAIEVSERAATLEAEGAVDQLARLHELGVGVLVDDFGTGYSSLAAIHQLPLTAVKIDRGFVHDLDDGASPLVTSILAVARSLELRVVAEGIETVAQRDQLRALGCSQGQGFLFGQALDAAAATELLVAQASGRPEPRVRRP
ncbi:MAG: putative bifunctional diguanylate cyclase/phosphodiesterase [Motilibacteraceae bacterium]